MSRTGQHKQSTVILVEEETDERRVLADLIGRFGSDSVPGRIAESINISPKVLRQMWQRPRGRALARDIAYRSIAPADYYQSPIFLIVSEKFYQEAMPAQITMDEEETVWNGVRHTFRSYVSGKTTSAQLFQLAMAWKGVTGLFGWAGAAYTYGL